MTKVVINEKVNKQRKLNAHIIDIPLYRCQVEILFKKETKKLCKYWNKEETFDGCTYNFLKEDRAVLVTFLSDNPTPEAVVHELTHAAQLIMHVAGHEMNNGADEPFAYLMGFLYKEYLSIRKKLGKPKKKKRGKKRKDS